MDNCGFWHSIFYNKCYFLWIMGIVLAFGDTLYGGRKQTRDVKDVFRFVCFYVLHWGISRAHKCSDYHLFGFDGVTIGRFLYL